MKIKFDELDPTAVQKLELVQRMSDVFQGQNSLDIADLSAYFCAVGIEATYPADKAKQQELFQILVQKMQQALINGVIPPTTKTKQ